MLLLLSVRKNQPYILYHLKIERYRQDQFGLGEFMAITAPHQPHCLHWMVVERLHRTMTLVLR